jgi:pilus assembly protein CpaC
VGGEIPIPVSNGLGSISIVYKEYGVNLKVTPTLLGNGSVEAKINPEVSDLDSASGVNINGFTIPGLKTSKLTTDVITQSGESIVMGGLLRHQEMKTITRIPLLSDIPILGALFRSTQYMKNDSDVVFVMTPTIVTR